MAIFKTRSFTAVVCREQSEMKMKERKMYIRKGFNTQRENMTLRQD